jgi:hypothetical protein
MKIRASAIGQIMTDPKGKDEILSVGAKSYIAKAAKEAVYGYDEIITSKYMDKGIQVEDQSIELYNMVKGTDYKKNTVRLANYWITGEADIVGENEIIDIKSSWSLSTFPALAKDGEDKGYEWQGRAYMWLYDKPQFTLAYCLVDTPEELIKYEDAQLHRVSHIIPELRVTTLKYERDTELEKKMMAKVEAARQYYDFIIKEIANQHS